MQRAAGNLNRRARQRLYAAAAILSLAVWLFMAAAEACTPLHAWLHGGTIPDNDNCAIVAITHGKAEPVVCDVPAVATVTWIEVAPSAEFFVFRTTTVFLPGGRAPPALPAIS